MATFVWLGQDKTLPMIAAAALVFVIRMIALQRTWSAPTARPVESGPTGWPGAPLRRGREATPGGDQPAREPGPGPDGGTR